MKIERQFIEIRDIINQAKENAFSVVNNLSDYLKQTRIKRFFFTKPVENETILRNLLSK